MIWYDAYASKNELGLILTKILFSVSMNPLISFSSPQ